MTSALTAPPWQVRIGGRWAISLPSYIVGVGLNVAILALTGGQIGAESLRLSDAPQWALLGLIASLIVGAYALAADASLFKNRRIEPVPVWLVVAFHFGVGVIFGTVVVIGGDCFIEASQQNPYVRIGVIGLIGLWWGLTAALVLEARDRFNREREALLDKAVALELASISEAEAAMKLRSTIAQQVGPDLDDTREQVDEVLAGFSTQTQTLLPIEEWWKISQSLRQTADSAIRPLSHQLWEATNKQYPRPRLGRVLSRLVLYQEYAVWPTVIILAIGYLPAGIYDLGAGGGLIATLAMAFGAGLILMLANRFMRALPQGHAAVFLTTLVVTQIYAIGYLAFLARAQGYPFEWNAEIIGGAIAVANSTLLPAAYASLNGVRDDVLHKFRIDTDQAQVIQLANAIQIARITREAARELHGTVQTRLISCAVAIEQASRSGDIEQFRRALNTSIAILDAPLPEYEQDASQSLAEEVERSYSPWLGLCLISTHIDPDVADMRGPVAMAAGRIVEEAVGNACRHGLAESVSITVQSVDGPALQFDVDDNGTGPMNGAPGLGTAMLAGISRGQVSLMARPGGGARLTVMLPLDEQARSWVPEPT